LIKMTNLFPAAPFFAYLAGKSGKELVTLESMWLSPALAQVMLTTRSLAPGISFSDCRDRLKSPQCRGSLQQNNSSLNRKKKQTVECHSDSQWKPSGTKRTPATARMIAIVWMQETETQASTVKPATSNSKDESNIIIMIAHNSRNESNNRIANTIWTPAKAVMLAKVVKGRDNYRRDTVKISIRDNRHITYHQQWDHQNRQRKVSNSREDSLGRAHLMSFHRNSSKSRQNDKKFMKKDVIKSKSPFLSIDFSQSDQKSNVASPIV
jgi:hypothetical protein